MHRLCIYVLYDSENIFDDYISNILKEMKLLCEKVVVIINAEDTSKDYVGDLSSADKIIVRQNKGYDAGAYKDCLCNDMTRQELQEFDEIVLMNDTFYGPIYPLEDSFRIMEKENVDFWGITRHSASVKNDKEIYPAHIQSYFIVLREKIIKQECFYRFWNNLQYPNSVKNAIQDFEIGFNVYLNENGFQGKALTEIFDILSLEKNSGNPYLLNSLELIRDMKVPFLKRRSLDLSNSGYRNALAAFQYIEKNYLFDSDIIKRHLLRKCKENKYAGLFNFCRLEQFYHAYDNIYIYGAGIMGSNLGAFFKYRKMPICGYVVSKKDKNMQEDIMEFGELEFSKDTGIIVAVINKKIALEIWESIKSKYNVEQILLPDILLD